MGALIHGDWKLIVGRQGYSDYRGAMYPCVGATPAPNCDGTCLYHLATDPHEHLDLSGDPSAAGMLHTMLALYHAESNLVEDVSTDTKGFNAAIQRRGGYMGPWMSAV